MLHSEKRSLFRFLAIYLSSTLLLFLLATLLFYNFQKYQIIDSQKHELDIEAERIIQTLQKLNGTFDTALLYPQKKPYFSAIYNLDKEYIFGSFHPKVVEWDSDYYQKEESLFHVHSFYPYYLGASYLVLTKEIDQTPIDRVFNISLLFFVIASIFFTLLGLLLGRLFTAPMKESLEQMNQFIEDTTHEFNTPISTILTNIELLNTFYSCDGKEEFNRIEVASQTLSRLYEDLTYLKLNHNYHREIESLHLSTLIKERVEFFKTLIEARKLKVTTHLEEDFFLDMDRNDAIRVIDNLLSNAIKYNKKEGQLTIVLNSKELMIENSGMGIKKEDIHLIQKRFKRANSSEGGFGIGLDIIGQVVKRYGFSFNLSSEYQKNTKVIIRWNR